VPITDTWLWTVSDRAREHHTARRQGLVYCTLLPMARPLEEHTRWWCWRD